MEDCFLAVLLVHSSSSFRYKPIFTLCHTLQLGFLKLKREFKSQILVSLNDTSLLTLFLPLALITALVLYH